MNSRCLLVIALCGLLIAQVQSANLGPQLLPLPAMAQSAGDANNPAKDAPGEIQFIQPSITLTADRDVVQAIDRDAAPVESNRTIAIDIYRKEPGKDSHTIVESSVPILDKDGNKVGEKVESHKLVGGPTDDKGTTQNTTTKGGAAQIKATYSLLTTIVSAITMTIVLV